MKNNISAYYKGHDPFIGKAKHWIQSAEQDYKPVVTCFLSPAEQQQLSAMASKHLFISFFGGYEQAERKMAFLCPLETRPEYDFAILASVYEKRFKSLSHKDILGALMHAGIKREFIGDLLVVDNTIYIIAKSSLTDFIIHEITQIGRCSVAFQPCRQIIGARPHTKERTVHVASLRLDALVAVLAHCSRSEASQKIRQGLVKVNDIVVEENRQLCNNNFVSIRRVGRFQLLETVSQTKKGRLVVRINQYI